LSGEGLVRLLLRFTSMRTFFHMRNAILRATLVWALVVISAAPVDAQHLTRRRAPNAVFLELFGNGGLWSVNYDRKLNETFSVRGGYTNWSSIELGDQPTKNYRFYLAMLNALFRNAPHRLELGVGVRVGSYDFPEFASPKRYAVSKLTSTVGYRYQPRTPGWIFRLGMIPEYTLHGYAEKNVFFSIGVSIGHGF
jgi:hypothetical protein